MVKRRKRTSHGLRLYFRSDGPGFPGDQLDVDDLQWAQHGLIRFFSGEELAVLRAAAPIRTSST